MPTNRKQQILSKIESSEGVDAAPGTSDAIQVYEPSLSDAVDIQDRVPAGPTLSRDVTPVGRKTRTLQFRSDLRGSGSSVTEPDFSKLLRAAGYAASSLKAVVVGAVTGIGFLAGEIVTQSAGAIRGVIVAIIQNTTNAPLHRTSTATDILVVAQITGTFTAAATAGAASASTSTASAVLAYPGFGYQPTSVKSVTVVTPAWSAAAPAVGDVIEVQQPAGITVGHIQILVDNGSMTNFDVTLLWGTMLATYTLRTAAGSTTTVTTAVQNKTPSLSFRHNLDGRRRSLLGSRGDFSLEGEVGAPMQFQWTFSGDLGTDIDAPSVATTGLSTVRPPRLLGAMITVGFGSLQARLPVKRMTFNNGGTVAPNLDAGRVGGSTGSNVTDRDPSITLQVDAVHGAFDWESLRDNQTYVRLSATLGTVLANMVGFAAAQCQVTEVALSDADGYATMDVTLRPRRVNESGDDEAFFFQL
jgi:hypothetical protein